jgi:hypothetical protein
MLVVAQAVVFQRREERVVLVAVGTQMLREL